MIKKLLPLATALCLLAGCTSNPNKISATDVSPLENYGDNEIVIDIGYICDIGSEITEEEAERGDAVTQYRLGSQYERWAQDYVEALKWYRKAAERGYFEAQFELGEMYANGKGVAKDDVEALKWYRKAAEQRYATQFNHLGAMYYDGEGAPEDAAEAVEWYRKLTEQGSHGRELIRRAQFQLGFIYSNGEGVAQDHVEAAKWYRKVAEQGHAMAQYLLGDMYFNGTGVTKDHVEALKWYRKAAQGERRERRDYYNNDIDYGFMVMDGQQVPSTGWHLSETWY
jgi:TPR repeat protein